MECVSISLVELVDVMKDNGQRHFRNNLARVPVACRHAGCEWKGPGADREAHEKTCAKRPVPCPGCGKIHPHDEAANHKKVPTHA